MARGVDKDALNGASGLPDAPGAERSNQRQNDLARQVLEIEAEERDRLIAMDPSRTPVTHRQMQFAFRHATMQDQGPYSERNQKRQAEEKRRDQQLERLAAWGAKMTTVGGVQMTNAQAQEARRHFIENEDYYAERAVAQGLIRDGEQEELKRTMRRRYELEDRAGRGTITADEQTEREQLRRSRMGRAADSAVAEIHRERKLAVDATVSAKTDARDIFQSAPEIQSQFATAATATSEAQITPKPPTPAEPVVPVARNVKAMGLDL